MGATRKAEPAAPPGEELKGRPGSPAGAAPAPAPCPRPAACSSWQGSWLSAQSCPQHPPRMPPVSMSARHGAARRSLTLLGTPRAGSQRCAQRAGPAGLTAGSQSVPGTGGIPGANPGAGSSSSISCFRPQPSPPRGAGSPGAHPCPPTFALQQKPACARTRRRRRRTARWGASPMATARAPSSAARRPAAGPARTPTVTLPAAPGRAACRRARCWEPTAPEPGTARCPAGCSVLPRALCGAQRRCGALRWGHARPFLLLLTQAQQTLPRGAGAEGRVLRRSARCLLSPPGAAVPPDITSRKYLPREIRSPVPSAAPQPPPGHGHGPAPAGEQPQQRSAGAGISSCEHLDADWRLQRLHGCPQGRSCSVCAAAEDGAVQSGEQGAGGGQQDGRGPGRAHMPSLLATSA